MSLFPKNQKKSRHREKENGILFCLCREGLLDVMLEEYVYFCHNTDNTLTEKSTTDISKGKNVRKARFPNIAGFCRFMKTGSGELEALSREFPDEYERILAVFEDEALNSEISSTLLSSYMKKRLSYDKISVTDNKSLSTGDVKICFEHDIFGDGE